MKYINLETGSNYILAYGNLLISSKILDSNDNKIVTKYNNKIIEISSSDFSNNWHQVKEIIKKNLTKKQLNEIHGNDLPDYYGHNWTKEDVIGSITNLFFECKESQKIILDLLEKKQFQIIQGV